MASCLVALLDDIAGLTKLAAASLDDVGAAAGKAGTQAVGVVVDDAAVTPRYVTGLSPKRELPIIGKIALGSLRNKLFILLPVALLLSRFAPWAVTPLLMMGGAYLCFEGAEKVIEAIGGGHEDEDRLTTLDAEALEKQQVSGAIRTDLILSAEIMAIALAEVASLPMLTMAAVLAAVGIAITVGVYGVVALIVKMDDIGLHLAKSPNTRTFGCALVRGMPVVMRVLSIIGTAAMIWVGGGILVHGLESFEITAPAHIIHHAAQTSGAMLPALGGALEWAVTAIGSGVIGFVVGAIQAAVVNAFGKMRKH